MSLEEVDVNYSHVNATPLSFRLQVAEDLGEILYFFIWKSTNFRKCLSQSWNSKENS